MRRIEEFESLRGLMALWVVISHLLPASGFHWNAWPGPLSLIGNGPLAVDVFIILSGFVIFLLLETRQESYRSFITRRFFRLFPVYLVCLTAAILTMDLAIGGLATAPWPHPAFPFWLDVLTQGKVHFSRHLLAHLTMLHGAIPESLLPRSQFALLPPAWSISLEWQFYLVAPLILYLCRRGFWPFLGVLSAATVVSLRFRFSDQWAFLPVKGMYFMTGIASFYLWKWKDDFRIPVNAWSYLVAVSSAVMYLLTRSVPILIWTLVFTAVVGVSCHGKGIEAAISSGLRWTWFKYLGKISYSMYLVHMVILRPVLGGVSRIDGLGQLAHLAVMCAIVLPLTIATSHLLHTWVEAPGIEWGRRLSRT